MSNQDRVSPHNIDTAEKVVDTLIDKIKRLIKSSRFISFNGYEMFAVWKAIICLCVNNRLSSYYSIRRRFVQGLFQPPVIDT